MNEKRIANSPVYQSLPTTNPLLLTQNCTSSSFLKPYSFRTPVGLTKIPIEIKCGTLNNKFTRLFQTPNSTLKSFGVKDDQTVLKTPITFTRQS